MVRRALGFRVVRKNNDPARTHFIADAPGKVLVEIYNNPAATVPDYASSTRCILHLAFASDDPQAIARSAAEGGLHDRRGRVRRRRPGTRCA